jgi:hypothetical protein
MEMSCLRFLFFRVCTRETGTGTQIGTVNPHPLHPTNASGKKRERKKEGEREHLKIGINEVLPCEL